MHYKFITSRQRGVIIIGCFLLLVLSSIRCSRPSKQVFASSASQISVSTEWRNPDGGIRWPPDEGFEHPPREVTIAVGTKLDRYGYPSGTFVSPVGVPAADLSLAPGALEKPHFVYQALKPLPALESS